MIRRKKLIVPRACVALLCLAVTASAVAAPRVIVISIDGLRPDVIHPEATPALAMLRDGGLWAAEALNDLPSVTLPNHTSMLTGLPTSVHGMIANTTVPGFVRFPTILSTARAVGLKAGFFASKTKMRYLAPPSDIDISLIESNLDVLVDGVTEALRTNAADLIFLHLREPDSTGHASGWLSSEYLDAVAWSDGQVARLVETLGDSLTRLDADRPTYLLITADHGGVSLNHFENVPENRRIPWILAGPDVIGGRIERPVTTLDTAPTVLALLGLEPQRPLDGCAIGPTTAATATAKRSADSPTDGSGASANGVRPAPAEEQRAAPGSPAKQDHGAIGGPGTELRRATPMGQGATQDAPGELSIAATTGDASGGWKAVTLTAKSGSTAQSSEVCSSRDAVPAVGGPCALIGLAVPGCAVLALRGLGRMRNAVGSSGGGIVAPSRK
ncbi:MAG: alkaline phosphatase family protein [Phycisphaerales bacterium]|nr:alkaline phosphatase family protein [Phycisphaerales bacterium]